MPWSRNVPTNPGYYWWYAPEHIRPALSLVELRARRERASEFLIYATGCEDPWYPDSLGLHGISPGLWLGPLEPPEPEVNT